MMIAVDRYILIVRPLDRRMSPPAALAGVVVVALLATGAALPIDARGPRRRGRRGAVGHRRRPADRRTRRRGGGRRRAAPAAPRLLHRALFRRCTEVDLNRSFVKYETVRVVVDKLRT